MRRFLIILILSIAALASCTPKTAATPSDFSLVLTWETGALPPEYTYSYEVIIGPELEGTLAYQFGYDGEDEANTYSSDFSLTQEQFDDLYTFFQKQGMIRSEWEEGEIMVGSPGSSLTLTADGETYQIPSLSELDGEDYTLMEEAIEKIEEAVPAELWEEMETRRQTYETEYEEE